LPLRKILNLYLIAAAEGPNVDDFFRKKRFSVNIVIPTEAEGSTETAREAAQPTQYASRTTKLLNKGAICNNFDYFPSNALTSPDYLVH
jgi:hypothetical protein